MGIWKKWPKLHIERIFPLFCLGFFAGIFVTNMAKTILLGDPGVFDEYILYRMKYMTVDRDALFCFVFRKRMLLLLGMAVMATTYLGLAVCYFAAVWGGMAVGAYLSTLLMRYGIKGLFLAAVSVFPQFIFYIPAICFMLCWSRKIYNNIYSRSGSIEKTSRFSLAGKMGQLAGIGGLVFFGALMEGYVNPLVLIGYLKVF